MLKEIELTDWRAEVAEAALSELRSSEHDSALCQHL